jgi:adenine nucleotide transporter 17
VPPIVLDQCSGEAHGGKGYEWTRAFFENAAERAGRSKKLTTVESMAAGAVAGSLTVLLTNPIWVVNTRMTARGKQDAATLPGGAPAHAPSAVGVFLRILREEGLGGLFAGVVPALVLVVNPILQYTIFEQLKNTLEKKRRITPTVAFLLGAFGKLVATTLTYPYITVKSRMHIAGKDSQKENMVDGMKRILKEEGYAGFYKGKELMNFLI